MAPNIPPHDAKFSRCRKRSRQRHRIHHELAAYSSAVIGLRLLAYHSLLAHRALQAEDKIGVMLPCNVILQELDDGDIEVAAIDPTASMERPGKPALSELAETVRNKLSAALARL